jgi:hypothetical protein
MSKNVQTRIRSSARDWDSFWKPAQVIAGGERATEAMLPRILELLHR